jgi:hypothetical protein
MTTNIQLEHFAFDTSKRNFWRMQNKELSKWLTIKTSTRGKQLHSAHAPYLQTQHTLNLHEGANGEGVGAQNPPAAPTRRARANKRRK